jgi:flagellar biosynthesis chaperone FliJ
MSGGRDLIFTILGIDKGSQAFDKVGNSAQRMGDRIDKAGTLAIKSMMGIEAAGIASGVAITGALAGAPLLFGAIAAAAVSGNKEVQDSFKNLASEVKSDVKSLAEPLAGDFVDIANDLSVAWEQRFAPALRMAFSDPRTMSGVKGLTTGVTQLASNALPGLLTMLSRSEPAIEGVRSALADTGTGFTEFARNISESSDDAGRVVAGFGRITSDALGDVGSLLSRLTSTVAPHMGEIEQLFDSTTNSVLGLATNALPVLSSASGATLGVLNSVLGVLEPISGTLGTGLGLTLAAAGGWRVLTGAGNAFTKLDLGGRLERTALSAGVMAESLTGSATAGERVATTGSKLANVLRGVGTAIPFVGAAAVGLTLAVDALSKPMEDAAERGTALAEALLKGGSEADQARKRLAELNAQNRDLQSQLTALSEQAKGAGDDWRSYTTQMSSLGRRVAENNKEISDAQTKYDEMRSKLTGAQLAQAKYNEAVEAHGPASTEAAAAGANLRAELDKEAAASRNAADAVKTHNDRLTERQNIMLGIVGAEINHQAALLGVEQAQKAYNDAVTKGGEASFEARSALNAYEGALLQAVQAAGARSRAENAAKSEADQARLATEAEARAILDLAAAAGDNAPPKLQNMVNGLNASTLAAIGVTGKVNEAGEAVYRLPDGREIKITGNNADAMAKMKAVNDYTINDKSFYITQIIRTDRQASYPGGPGYARGGEVDAGPVKMNEEGVETFVPTPGVIIPHSATVAMQRAGRLGEIGGGSVTKNYNLTIYNAGNTDVDLRTQFRRMELLSD